MAKRTQDSGRSEESKQFRKRVGEQVGNSRGNRKEPEDAIDEMIRQNVELNGP